MKHKIPFQIGTLELWLGVGIGSVLTAIIFEWTRSASFKDYVHDYQTLFAALVAVGAAYAATRKTGLQIEQSYELEEERRRRRNNAARTALPLALSELCEYSRQCMDKLSWLYGRDLAPDGMKVILPHTKRPTFPAVPTVIPVLADCVETSDAEQARNLSALVANLQIQNARLTGTKEHWQKDDQGLVWIAKRELELFMLDTLEIYARATAQFDFARSGDTYRKGMPTREEMTAACFGCNLFDNTVRDTLLATYDETLKRATLFSGTASAG